MSPIAAAGAFRYSRSRKNSSTRSSLDVNATRRIVATAKPPPTSGFHQTPSSAIYNMANRSQAQIMIFNRKMLEFLDSLDRGAQQRDNSATLHHLSDRFERQAAAATACSNVMIEQCNPSLASLGE